MYVRIGYDRASSHVNHNIDSEKNRQIVVAVALRRVEQEFLPKSRSTFPDGRESARGNDEAP